MVYRFSSQLFGIIYTIIHFPCSGYVCCMSMCVAIYRTCYTLRVNEKMEKQTEIAIVIVLNATTTTTKTGIPVVRTNRSLRFSPWVLRNVVRLSKSHLVTSWVCLFCLYLIPNTTIKFASPIAYTLYMYSVQWTLQRYKNHIESFIFAFRESASVVSNYSYEYPYLYRL